MELATNQRILNKEKVSFGESANTFESKSTSCSEPWACLDDSSAKSCSLCSFRVDRSFWKQMFKSSQLHIITMNTVIHYCRVTYSVLFIHNKNPVKWWYLYGWSTNDVSLWMLVILQQFWKTCHWTPTWPVQSSSHFTVYFCTIQTLLSLGKIPLTAIT